MRELEDRLSALVANDKIHDWDLTLKIGEEFAWTASLKIYRTKSSHLKSFVFCFERSGFGSPEQAVTAVVNPACKKFGGKND